MANEKRAEKVLYVLLPILLTAALAYGAWLGLEVVGLKTVVARLAEKIARVDDGLGDIGIRISAYEVVRERDMAVVYSNAAELGSGMWAVTISVFDWTEGKAVSQSISVEDQRYREYVMANAVLSGLDPIPFSVLEDWAEEAGDPVLVPSYVDKDLSIVCRRRIPDYIEVILSRIDAEPLGGVVETDIRPDASSWRELVAELSRNASRYGPDIHTTS